MESVERDKTYDVVEDILHNLDSLDVCVNVEMAVEVVDVGHNRTDSPVHNVELTLEDHVEEEERRAHYQTWASFVRMKWIAEE